MTEKSDAADGAKKRETFAIFRARDGKDCAEHDCMTLEDMTPVITDGLTRLTQSGSNLGSEIKLLYAAPGFSLTHVWFKSGYPLPLHSHNADCLYYIVAGSVQMGTETLGAGDGFFVGTDVPYTYTPGEDGAEVLEFRTAEHFNIRFMARTVAAWDTIAAKAEAHLERWKTEKPPAPMVPAE